MIKDVWFLQILRILIIVFDEFVNLVSPYCLLADVRQAYSILRVREGVNPEKESTYAAS